MAVDLVRQIDCLLAEKVLDYERRIVQPSWYPIPVHCFYWLPAKLPLMAYSYDENACNASMFANGRDAKDGYASPLPGYADEDSEGYEWSIVEAMLNRGHGFWLTSCAGIYRTSYMATFYPGKPTSVVEDAVHADWPQAAIGLAALKAMGVDVNPFHEVVKLETPHSTPK